MQLSSEQAMFYMFQFFQMLGTRIKKLVQFFLLSYARKSPLFSHNLIWNCKLEAKATPADDNYFVTHEERREVSLMMIQKIFENFSIFEKNVFEELDYFLTSITDISSAMIPSMSPEEKQNTILRCVEHIKIPSLAYLPTNPSMQVVDIVRTSGKAMQSAAKCPFLLSFICRPFEGIDKLILMRKQSLNLTKIWNDVSIKLPMAIEIRKFDTNFHGISVSNLKNGSFVPLKKQDSVISSNAKIDVGVSDISNKNIESALKKKINNQY